MPRIKSNNICCYNYYTKSAQYKLFLDKFNEIININDVKSKNSLKCIVSKRKLTKGIYKYLFYM